MYGSHLDSADDCAWPRAIILFSFFLKKKKGQSASVEIPGLAYYTHTLGWTSGPEAIFLGRSFSRIYWRNHQQPQKPVNTIRERKEAFLPFI